MRIIMAAMILVLAALSWSCSEDTPMEMVKDIRQGHCEDMESDSDYRECLAELDKAARKHPDAPWTQCAVATVRGTRYLNKNSEMLTKYMLSPPGPRSCAMYKWMEDHRPAMLKAMNKCQSLGGAPWMSGNEWKEYRRMITSIEPLSAVKNRCLETAQKKKP